MTYAEAVLLMELSYLDTPAFAEALAVLRRAEPLLEAVESGCNAVELYQIALAYRATKEK
jgi:hypothetical protein